MADQRSYEKTTEERTLLEGIVDYLSILLSYKWLLIFITMIAVVWAVLFSIISRALPPEISPFPNVYESHAVLLMEQKESSDLSFLFASFGLGSPDGSGGFSPGFDYAKLAIRILQSPAILDALVDEFDIVERYNIRESVKTFSRQAIMERSEFNYDRSTGTIAVSFESIDPVFSKNMSMRMVQLLDQWFSTRGGSTRLKQKEALEQKISEVLKDISRLESQIQNFQEKYGVLTIEELATYRSKMLEDLRSQLMLKEMEIKNYALLSQIEDPALMRLRSEKDNLLAQIKIIERGFTDPSGTVLPSKEDLPKISQKFERIVTDLEIQRKIYEAISQQYELTKLSLESVSMFQIIEAPEVPDMKSGPSRGSLCVITTLLALLTSIFLAFILNVIKKIRKNPIILKRLMGRVR